MSFARGPLPEITEYSSKDFYWGVIPQEEMRRFIVKATEEGFEAARANFAFSGRFDYADDFSRADFHMFLPIGEGAAILDLGSGYGNVTIPLSQHYASVTAADGSRELLDISRVRARDLGRKNISFVHIDPLGSGPLPFRDASFDAVILNGVLEWVGLSHKTENPRRIQEFLLSEISRLLRPGGLLYVGIENRWFPGWLGRDPHSKLPYTTILPRWLADWYARRCGIAEGYRTYIYGFRSYLRMFKKYFVAEATLIPYTSYRDPVVIYPHAPEARRFLFSRGYAKNVYTKRWYVFLRALNYIGLQHLFVSSFMFILRKESGQEQEGCLAARLLSATHPEHFRKGDVLIKIASSKDVRIVAIRKGGSEPYGVYTIIRGPAGALQKSSFAAWNS